MQRRAVSNTIAVALLVGGIIIGVTGLYLATSYQTKTIVETTTQLETTSLTNTVTRVSIQPHTTSLTETLTQMLTSTALQTSTTISATTYFTSVNVYPIPDNVTLAFTNVVGNLTYSIQAGTSSISGEASGDYSFMIGGLFQGQTIAISAATGDNNGCRAGQHFTVELFVNREMVAQSATSCGGSAATIAFTV